MDPVEFKACEYCTIQHNKPGRFCSRACVNKARGPRSKETREAIRKAVNLSLDTRKQPDWKQINNNPSVVKKRQETWKEKRNFSKASTDTVKRWLLEEISCCQICGINSWLNKPIVLELDHIDGDSRNNKRENLRILCPNCHSQTPTWKNRKRSHSSTE